MKTVRSSLPGATLVLASGEEYEVGTIHILESGWLRVHWMDDGAITYVSPNSVHEIAGQGVIISDE